MTLEQNEILAVRRAKLEALREAGIDPFGGAFQRSHSAAEVRSDFEELDGREVSLAGRIMARREHGKASFADLRDRTGLIQLHFRQDILGEDNYSIWLHLTDIGDIVGVQGKLFRTRRGEITIEVESWTLLTKSLRPLPEKWHGLKDIELRYRQRYLDLMMNPGVQETFQRRTQAIKAIRQFLDERGFVEVETSSMHSIPGGAAARPFITYHNALQRHFYLRIALELHLKRLLVGGLEKVYELGRVFRNEGISTRHNPEFTMLEVYEAYSDYAGMMSLTEEMIARVAEQTLGATRLTYQGQAIDLTPPWPRLTMLEAVERYAGVDFRALTSAAAREAAARLGVEVDPVATWGQVLNTVFEERVESHLVQPVFILDYPAEISPLAKTKADDPRLVYRFEAYIACRELANAFSELNDPLDQRRRFEEQAAQKEAGDVEGRVIDDDFLTALEYGMPPAGGLGIGIDRLVMLLTDAPSIRDAILFPTLRPGED